MCRLCKTFFFNKSEILFRYLLERYKIEKKKSVSDDLYFIYIMHWHIKKCNIFKKKKLSSVKILIINEHIHLNFFKR